jgi:polysaccharide export outer membrane protein
MDVCAVDAVPRELDKASLPEYVVEPPDVIFVEALNTLPTQPLVGEKLVRPDGTINLGYYGDIHVAGRTLAEIEAKIEERLKHYVNNPRVHVDVAAFNSKVFYVMGQVVQPGRLPLTGNETVLDAVMLSGGLTNYADKCKIRLVRPRPMCGCDLVLPVDWEAIVKCGDTTTNYQLMAGDRVLVNPTSGFETAVFLDNFLTPVERILGVINLGRLAFGPTDSN